MIKIKVTPDYQALTQKTQVKKQNGHTGDLLQFKTDLFLCLPLLFRYTVMSGTPEKILEHLLETVKLDSNGNDAIGGRSHKHLSAPQLITTSSAGWLTECCCDVCPAADPCVGDFLLTHKVFMPSGLLCPALQHQYPGTVDNADDVCCYCSKTSRTF